MKNHMTGLFFFGVVKGLVRDTLSDSFRTLPRLSILPILFTLAGKHLTLPVGIRIIKYVRVDGSVRLRVRAAHQNRRSKYASDTLPHVGDAVHPR